MKETKTFRSSAKTLLRREISGSFGILCLALGIQGLGADAFAAKAEVYEAIVPTTAGEGGEDAGFEHDGDTSVQDRTEIRLSRPEEAQSRRAKEDILDDPQFAQVEGAQVLSTAPGSTSVAGNATAGRMPASSSRSAPKLLQQEPEAAAPVAKTGKAKNASSTASAHKSNAVKGQRTPGFQNETADAPTDQAALASPNPNALSPIPVRDEVNLKYDSASLRSASSFGLASETATFSGTVQEVSLIASEQGFYPANIVVTQGTAVKIYLSTPGQMTLCFMNDQFGLQKGISPGQVQEVSFVPNRVGLFRFYCPIRGLEGKLTVRAPGDHATAKARVPASVSTDEETE